MRPLIEVSEKFKEFYTPSTAISIDESICPFRGKFRHLVYEPRKPHKWGIKLINECDALTGYCLAINPCLGKETYLQNSEITNLDQLLMNKCIFYNDSNYHFYCDNYYCHPNLAVELKKLGHDMTGTIRVSRKDVPCCFAEAKVRKGELKGFESEEGIYLLKYKDKREINVLTTCDSLCFKDYTSRRGIEYKKPCVVVNYSNRMKGVDTLNQLTHYNWYFNLFKDFINLVPYKKHGNGGKKYFLSSSKSV